MENSALSRGGGIYVGCVIVAGGAAIAHACADLYQHPLDWQWFILAGLTLLSGSITVKVPSVPATISVSETFVFTAVMLFGPSAGTITVALDGLIISLWLQRKKREAVKAFFNVAAPSLSLWASAQLYYALSRSAPLASGRHIGFSFSDLLFPLVAFTLSYFLLNSALIAVAIALEKKTSALKVWRENFVWLSLNFFSGASVAALLVASSQRLDSTTVGIIIPLLIISYLSYKTSMGRLEDTTKHLGELNLLYLSTIETLAMWIDAKDQITHGHIRRVQNEAVELAKDLGVKDGKLIKAIEAAALLHDMGKLAVPEHILNKPGKLTPGEFEKMKMHASVGAQILSSIDFPYPVVPIVRHHHENWDGTGYPDGLAGTDIPIGARILAVVDCFDALTSDRPYRPRLRDSEALRMLAMRRGSMYDPLVVDAFLKLRSANQQLTATPSQPESESLQDLGTSSDKAKGRPLVADIPAIDLRGDVGKTLLDVARQAVPVSLAILFSHDGQDDTLRVAHCSGDGSGLVTALTLKVGQGVSGWVAANRRAMANSDSVLDLGDSVSSDGAPLKCCLSIPVLFGDSLLGVLTLYSTERNRFSLDDKEALESRVRDFVNDLGSRAITLDGAPVAIGSSTTKLPGPADHGLLHGQLNGQRVAVIALHVKPTPALPELAGLELASAVDHAVRMNLRSADLTIRTGEHEILVVLPQSDMLIATNTAERVTNTLRGTFFDGGGARVFLEVTAGLAISPDNGSSLESLLTAARRGVNGSSSDLHAGHPTVH